MASYNRVILMGNVTRDIQLRYTPAGTPVTEVGMAVNDRRKNQNGEWVDETTFVDVTFWGRTAEVAAEYLSKGSPVFVEGRLKLDTWEKDGQKNYKLRVVCDRMQLLGGRGSPGPRNESGHSDAGHHDSGHHDSGHHDSGHHEASYSESDYVEAPTAAHKPQSRAAGGDEIPF